MPDQSATIPKSVKFLFGGTAGMGATMFVQPLDLVKNRMQLSGADGGAKAYKNSFQAFTSILRNEGVTGIYSGLSAGLLRQASYTTVRLGVYTSLFEKFSKPDGTPPSFLTKAGIGMTAGLIGAFFGTPAEVCLIRMTADGSLPVAERRHYTNAFSAVARIAKEEGIVTLWRGAVPTMGRAAVVNIAQLVSYSQAKEFILSYPSFENGIFVHFLASMFSGLITTIASMPVDIAKTRLQVMKSGEGGPQYTGIYDVLSKLIRNEGILSLWKGFTPYFFRLGPHTVLTFIFLEQMNYQYRRVILHQADASGGNSL